MSKRWLKQWSTVDLASSAYQEMLAPRIKLAEARHDKLSDASVAYEEATEDPTPLEDARLERMILIHNRARDAMERLERRMEIAKRVLSLWEEMDMLSKR